MIEIQIPLSFAKIELPPVQRRIQPKEEDEDEKKKRASDYGYGDMEPQSCSSIRPVLTVEPPAPSEKS